MKITSWTNMAGGTIEYHDDVFFAYYESKEEALIEMCWNEFLDICEKVLAKSNK